jgi:hypothetical protein
VAPLTTQEEVIASYDDALKLAEMDFAVAAARDGQFEYLWGALIGFAALAVGGTLLAAGLARLWGSSITDPGVATALGCAAAGAIGTCASISWRVTAGDALKLNTGAGVVNLRRLGQLRPMIGATFGAAVYFAFRSGVINLGQEVETFYLYAFLAFVAGFSERVVPDLMKRTEQQLQNQAVDNQPAGTASG